LKGIGYGIEEDGSKVAKADCDFSAAGGSGGDSIGVVEREEAGGEDIGGDADAGKFGVVDQQQWESGADIALCDEGATGYVCAEDLYIGRADGEEGAAAAGVECEGSDGAVGGNAGEAAACAE